MARQETSSVGLGQFALSADAVHDDGDDDVDVDDYNSLDKASGDQERK